MTYSGHEIWVIKDNRFSLQLFSHLGNDEPLNIIPVPLGEK